MSPTDVQVAIVGAGPAGLSAAAALKRQGIEPVVFDEDERIGGRWARRYERLHLHTVRRFSGLAHRAMPRSYPRYVPKDLVAEYLRDYADHFRLDVRLGHRVDKIRPENAGHWQLDAAGATWRTPVVIVATGHYNRPVVPPWPGREQFRGTLLHSNDYRTGREYEGRRALVVGIGNTGAEIAADLVEQGAAHVAIAVRTTPPIVPRELLGLVPIQLFGLALSPIPAPRLLDRMGAGMRRVAIGDLARYGLGPAAWGPFTARKPPVIDVGFLRELKRRRVVVRPAVSRLSPQGVVFADGSDESYDVVIAATGFETALPELLDLPDAIDEHGMPRFPSGRPTSYAGLYFIGFEENIGGHLRRANVESRRLAKEVRGYLTRTGSGTSSA
jgi:cation diffusion facilitator CzcD-associated flavoprotein CzcO